MINERESILRSEEIQQLENFVRQRPSLCCMPAATYTPNERVIIEKVSCSKGLILIRGNHCTGLEQILLRHQLAATLPFWIDAQSEGSSFFNEGITGQNSALKEPSPFIDYMFIAEKLYKPENLVTNRQNSSSPFDRYCGLYVNTDGSTDSYTLVMYKDSKVIHNLFPETRQPAETPNLFFKGKVTGKWLTQNKSLRLTVPYYDMGNVKRFAALIQMNLVIKSVECRIIVNNIKGKPIGYVRLPDRSFKSFTSLENEVEQLQKKHLKSIEECIRYTSNTLNSIRH